jgi:uncharacterized protein YbjQ (UPF0145 family)
MTPLGLVKGYAVMQWSWYASGGSFMSGGAGTWGIPSAAGSSIAGGAPYQETWQCPHGFVGPEHRGYGYNLEQTWVEENWARGFNLAYGRMMEEAAALGAHGIVGVVDDMHHLSGSGAAEFSFQGTAVAVPGADRPATPFATYLAGQRLAKLIEAGYVPVGIVGTLSSVQMIGSCVTHFQMEGGAGATWGMSSNGSIQQVGRAQQNVRRLAREHVRSQLGGDALHGATFEQFDREIGESMLAIQCVVKGTRVRRFGDFDPLPGAEPVVRLT